MQSIIYITAMLFNGSVHVEACQQALLAIRQMMWFNEHGMAPNIRSVMRIMLDFRSRTKEFQALSPWVHLPSTFIFQCIPINTQLIDYRNYCS